MCVEFAKQYDCSHSFTERIPCHSPIYGCQIPTVQVLYCESELCTDCTLLDYPPMHDLPMFDYVEKTILTNSFRDLWPNAEGLMTEGLGMSWLILQPFRPMSPSCQLGLLTLYGIMKAHFWLNPQIERRKKLLMLQIRTLQERDEMEKKAKVILNRAAWTRIEEVFQAADLERVLEVGFDCGICTTSYGALSSGAIEHPVVLPCHQKHIYGNICLHRILGEDGRCPMCRQQLVPRGLRQPPFRPRTFCPLWVLELTGGRHPCMYYLSNGEFNEAAFLGSAPTYHSEHLSDTGDEYWKSPGSELPIEPNNRRNGQSSGTA